MIKYVLFDLDGTLSDPAEGITNSIAYALTRCGIEPPSRDALLKYIGPPLIPSFMADFGMSEEEAFHALAEYRVNFEKSGMFENELYEGIPELLASLAARGVKLGVATSKPEPYAREIIKHFGLEDSFDFVAGSLMNETRVGKDEVIAYCMAELGVAEADASCVAMVGDREYDIIGAKKCGVKSVGVLYGYGSIGEFEANGADYIARDIHDLASLLLGLCRLFPE